MLKYKSFFSNENLAKLQSVYHTFQQLKYTQTTELITTLLTKLRFDHSWYLYLFKVIKFFDDNFPEPFNLINADLFRRGMTFDEWLKIDNHCFYTVQNGGHQYKITYPAYPGNPAGYRHLQSAMRTHHRLRNYCYQSERQTQAALLGFHLLSSFLVFQTQ